MTYVMHVFREIAHKSIVVTVSIDILELLSYLKRLVVWVIMHRG